MLRPLPASTPVRVLLVALSVGLTWNFDSGLDFAGQSPAQNATPPGLHITVLEGEDGVNILKTKMAVKPVVEVRDRNNLPVADAAVLFLAPNSGPRVAFAHGSNSFSTTTDANGRAVVRFSKPVGQGSFKINIKVNFNGQSVIGTITQTNYLTAAAATAAGATVAAGAGTGIGISGAVIGIIVAGVAAAAVATALVLTRGSKTTPTGTIGGVGTPTITHH
jgi:hypothetical protein